MQKNKMDSIVKFCFFLYIIVLIKLIIFKYSTEYLMGIVRTWEKGVILEGLSTANFTPGKTIRMYIRYFPRFNGFPNLVGNVLAFIPYGYLLPRVYPRCRRWWRVFYCAVVFVLCIELFQLFSAFGAFDVDDIILNVSGAMIGYMIYSVYFKHKKYKKYKKVIDKQ